MTTFTTAQGDPNHYINPPIYHWLGKILRDEDISDRILYYPSHLISTIIR